MRGNNRRVNGSGSCCSSLSSPALAGLCVDVEKEQEAGVGGIMMMPASACHEAPSSSLESSERSDSESPDLLRSYTMGVRAESQQPTMITARDHFSSKSRKGGSAAVKGIVHCQSASEESDTGSDSPDLLRANTPVDTSVVEGAKQAVVTAGRATGQEFLCIGGDTAVVPGKTHV